MLLCACLIVRNEASMIERCLRSLSGIADEICIVDTGSDDQTVSLAQALGARVLVDRSVTNRQGRLKDFSFARNLSLRMTKAKWILTIDADEVLDVGDRGKFREQLEVCEAHAIEVCMRAGRTRWYLPRLFKRQPWTKYHGRVHEWVEIRGPTLRSDSITIQNLPNKAGKESGADRDLRLCRKELKENPGNLRAVLYIARAWRRKDRYSKALPFYDRYWHRSDFQAGRYLAAYEIAMCHLLLRHWEDCRRFALKAYRLDSRLAEACCMLGDVSLATGRLDLARSWFSKALSKAPGPIGYPLFIDVSCYESYPRERLIFISALHNAALSSEKNLGLAGDPNRKAAQKRCP